MRKLLSYLPLNGRTTEPKPEKEASRPLLNHLVPADTTKPYDVRKVIRELADPQSFFEIQPFFAKNIVIGFARLGEKAIGIVASQPKHLAGSLTIDAADKAARFIRFCDAFDIPLLTVEDVRGFCRVFSKSTMESSGMEQNYCLLMLKRLSQKSHSSLEKRTAAPMWP